MSLTEVFDEREREFADRFRASHHAVAMMFAMGYTANMICRQTGRSRRSLSLLYNDPLFRELIAVKQARVAEIGADKLEEFAELDLNLNSLMKRNLITMELMVMDRLEEANEKGPLPSYRDLNVLIADRADRQGHSKHTIVHHDHDFAARLDRAIARSGKTAEVKQIDLEPERIAYQPPAAALSLAPTLKVEAPRHESVIPPSHVSGLPSMASLGTAGASPARETVSPPAVTRVDEVEVPAGQPVKRSEGPDRTLLKVLRGGRKL